MALIVGVFELKQARKKTFSCYWGEIKFDNKWLWILVTANCEGLQRLFSLSFVTRTAS